MAGPRWTQWYIQFNEGEEVPVTSQDLRDLARAGVIHPHTRVRKEGMPKAVPASKVRGLLQHPPESHVEKKLPTAESETSVTQLPDKRVVEHGIGEESIEKSDGSGSPESFFHTAEAATIREEFQTAIENYSLFIEKELNDTELLNIAHTNRGLILIHFGSIEKGKQDLIRAIELGSEKAGQIYSEFFEKPRSTTIVHQGISGINHSEQSSTVASSKTMENSSRSYPKKSLWILVLGAIINLLVYIISPFGKGVGLHIFVSQLATVLALTVVSYGIVSFFDWLASLLIKQNLPSIHRAIISSVVCTLIILGAILNYHIHGK